MLLELLAPLKEIYCIDYDLKIFVIDIESVLSKLWFTCVFKNLRNIF